MKLKNLITEVYAGRPMNPLQAADEIVEWEKEYYDLSLVVDNKGKIYSAENQHWDFFRDAGDQEDWIKYLKADPKVYEKMDQGERNFQRNLARMHGWVEISTWSQNKHAQFGVTYWKKAKPSYNRAFQSIKKMVKELEKYGYDVQVNYDDELER